MYFFRILENAENVFRMPEDTQFDRNEQFYFGDSIWICIKSWSNKEMAIDKDKFSTVNFQFGNLQTRLKTETWATLDEWFY